MPLTSYEEARPWARAIREEILARRMPKWHIVRGYGDFVNDPSLSAFEVALIVAWVDGGAPHFAKASGGKPADDKASASAEASPFAKATGDRPGNTVNAPGRNTALAASKNVTIPCTSRTLPAGRLVALRPLLTEGASLRLTTLRPDGSEEPLLWLRAFDPAFAETYWLRSPVAERGTRLIVAASDVAATCSVTLLFE